MLPTKIDPKYRLVLMYDVLPESQDEYLRFMLGEFIPEVQKLGLYMHMAWHIAYGPYPIRRIEFVADDSQDIHTIFQDPDWIDLEERLRSYIFNYQRKLLRYRRGFQV